MVRMLAPRLPLARTAIVRLPPKEADPYYLTPEWRELRRQTLERDGGVCTVPGCGRAAVVADHIVSRKAGGADALPNLRSLCPCTTIASAKVRLEGAANARKGRGFRIAPRPTPGNRAPQHAQNFFAATNRFQQVAKIKGAGGREKARKCGVF
jgi:5-methylcytosine-specific restriction enzyme A